MNNTQQAKVYDCYLVGLTVEEVSKKLNVSFGQIKKYYTNFIVYSAKIKSGDKSDKLAQIYDIERKLFHMIENEPNNPQINNLSYIYSTYCI
jgi:hypothetical protein